MSLAKLALFSSASYATMVSVAHADPISLGLGNAIFSALYTIGLPGAVANFVAVNGLALAAGAAAIVGSFNRPKAGAVNTQQAKSTFEGEESSVLEGVGRVRVGGMQVFGNTDGNTRARVICRLQGPIDAVETFYMGGREVIVEVDGDVSSPPWVKPGGSWAKWRDKIGDGTETAWGELTSYFPDLWTSAHRVRGIAQSMLLFFNPGLSEPKFLSLYQNGAPTTEQVIRASRIYDPFDENCDVDDPSTWVWADNGILIATHVLRRDPAFTSDRFDWALITLEAVKAIASVETLTGTERRSRAWGIWAWESGRAETMQQLLDSIGAEIRLTDEGKIWFELIDDAITPEFDVSPLDTYEISLRSGPDAVERPNICRLKYYSPERNYELSEITLLQFDEGGNNIGAPWAHVADEVERYGPKYFDLELPFCPSASQAQRIARRKFAIARGETGVVSTNMVGLAGWGLLYGSVALPDLGDVLNVRMEPPRCDDDNGSVEIPFTVWPTLSPWNPATDEMPAPDVIPEIGYQTGMTTPDMPYAALQITYPNGGKELRVGYVLPDQPYDSVEAVLRTYTGTQPNAYQQLNASSALGYGTGDFLGQTIDARVRVFNGEDGTFFSPVLHVSAVGVDNAPCAAPTKVSGGATGGEINATLDVVMRVNELRAASIRLSRRNASGSFVTIDTKNARPGMNVAFTDIVNPPGGSGDVYWRLQSLTSDGTAGSFIEFTASVSEI